MTLYNKEYCDVIIHILPEIEKLPILLSAMF